MRARAAFLEADSDRGSHIRGDVHVTRVIVVREPYLVRRSFIRLQSESPFPYAWDKWELGMPNSLRDERR